MAEKEVKLLGAWPSPFVMRARIALNIKSVEYEFLEENLGSKSELLLKCNPVHKKIPVLIHHDKPISESLIIVEYIDEVWTSGPSILPSEPYHRALSRFWANYLDEKWFPNIRSLGTAETEEAKKACIDNLEEGLTHLEDAYITLGQGKPFFGGDKIGYLDIAMGCFLGWLRVTEKFNKVELLDESKTPYLSKWVVNFCADPAVKDVMPETEKLAEFAKILAKARASAPK